MITSIQFESWELMLFARTHMLQGHVHDSGFRGSNIADLQCVGATGLYMFVCVCVFVREHVHTF
jgi:hypothetical protein